MIASARPLPLQDLPDDGMDPPDAGLADAYDQGEAAPSELFGGSRFTFTDGIGLDHCQGLLARHLAAVQAAYGPPGLGVIDLPPVRGGRLVPAQIHASAVLYWASELEGAGLLPFVEALARALVEGALAIPLGAAAQPLSEFWHSRSHRFTGPERAALYARVLGDSGAADVRVSAPAPGDLRAPGPGDPSGAAAIDAAGRPVAAVVDAGGNAVGVVPMVPAAGEPVLPLLRVLVATLVAINRAPTFEGTTLMAARARVQAQELGGLLSDRGAGVAAFAARDIVGQIRSALAILSDADVSRAFGGGTPWMIVSRHAQAFLGRRPAVQPHIDRARAGMRILAWIGDNAGAIDGGSVRIGRGDPVIADAESWSAADGAE